ncbi:exported hypothetical protein [Mesorhizobium sp. STM 4661]|nr:exported hypothetical protein [Mesorhizobium sp. STM 4661]
MAATASHSRRSLRRSLRLQSAAAMTRMQSFSHSAAPDAARAAGVDKVDKQEAIQVHEAASRSPDRFLWRLLKGTIAPARGSFRIRRRMRWTTTSRRCAKRLLWHAHWPRRPASPLTRRAI